MKHHKNKKRVFIALNFPAAIINFCAKLQKHIQRVMCKHEIATEHMRFIPSDRLHLTMVPPMYVTEQEEIELVKILANIQHNQFQLCTTQVGYFKKASVVWLGVESNDALHELVQNMLQHISFHENIAIQLQKTKEQTFTGHITLVRNCILQSPAEILAHMNEQVSQHCFIVDHFVLKETLLQKGSLISYQDIATFKLAL